jgi:hypothetical protein
MQYKCLHVGDIFSFEYPHRGEVVAKWAFLRVEHGHIKLGTGERITEHLGHAALEVVIHEADEVNPDGLVII